MSTVVRGFKYLDLIAELVSDISYENTFACGPIRKEEAYRRLDNAIDCGVIFGSSEDYATGTSTEHIVGFVALFRSGNEPQMHRASLWFGVDKLSRGHGHGEALLNSAIDMAKTCNFDVLESRTRASNEASRKLHKKVDMEALCRIPKAVKYGNEYHDDIMYVKDLKA